MPVLELESLREVELTDRDRSITMIGILTAMLLAALDQSIVTPAMPTIGGALGNAEYLPWIVTAYLLTATAAAPLYGKIADIYGRRGTLYAALGLFLLGSVTVFWVAHLYSGTIARLPESDPTPRTVLAAVRDTARHSIGMIAAMVVPALLLALGPLGVLDEWTAYYLALGAGVAILAALGYLMSARRGSSWKRRVLSTLVTTLLGFVVVWLSTLVH